MAHGGECSEDKRKLLFFSNDVQQMMCTIIVRDMICISWSMKKTDCKVIIFYPSPTFGRVRCGCECQMLTQDPWGSKLPRAEASSRCIRIRVHWLFLDYGQYSPETCQVLYLQKEIIQRERTQCSLSTISPKIDEWRRAITWRDFTTCRMALTWAIVVRLQSVHLNGHWWASQLIIYP